MNKTQEKIKQLSEELTIKQTELKEITEKSDLAFKFNAQLESQQGNLLKIVEKKELQLQKKNQRKRPNPYMIQS